MNIVYFLLIGAVSGWLAGIVLKGGGFGLLGNIIVGIIGALIGGFLFWFPWSFRKRIAWFHCNCYRWCDCTSIWNTTY